MEQLPVTSAAAHTAAQRQKNPDVRLRRIQRLESQFGATIYVLNRRKEYVLHGFCNLLLY